MEIWKDINGFGGIYEVSNLGNVRSLDREYINNGFVHNIKGKILKSSFASTGYKRVALCNNEGRKYIYVHRLVLIAFKDLDNKRPQVNHINGIKSDNRLSNLEWCSRSENMNHAYSMGLKITTQKQLDATSKKIIDTKNNIIYNSIREASILLGINYSTLRNRIKPKNSEKYNLKFL